MAQITKLVDDLDGVTDAEMTLSFGLDGTEYEIDLADENYENYRQMLELLASKGRVVVRETPKRKTLSTGKKTGGPGKTQAMREWLRSQGHQVSDRGRVPQNLVDLWETRPRLEDIKPVDQVHTPNEVKKALSDDEKAEAEVVARVKATPKTNTRKPSTRGKAAKVEKSGMDQLREHLTLVSE